MYRSVMVPLDGSAFGEHALPVAAHIARRCDARLQLVNVFAPLGSIFVEGYLFPDDAVERYLRQRQTEYLHRMAERLRQLTPTPITVHALEGSVDDQLRQLARDSATDLIVMTTHGRSPLSRFWIGSVTDDLLRDAPAPVLVMRPTAEKVDWTRDPLPRHLLIPLDGSVLAEEVLEPAINLGMLSQAEYTLLQTVKPVMPMPYQVDDATMERVANALIDQIEIAQEALCKQALAYLNKMAGPMRARGLTVHTRVVLENQPATAILRQAVAPVDFVALRTHARHGLARMFLGSVADKVVRSATVPVLVQPPRKL